MQAFVTRNVLNSGLATYVHMKQLREGPKIGRNGGPGHHVHAVYLNTELDRNEVEILKERINE